MKKLNKYILVLLALTVIVPACKDEDLVILPEWGTAVHGETLFSDGSATNFKSGDGSIELSFDIYWNSIDTENTVEKIEIVAFFSEAFVDIEGNPKTAAHGGDNGLSLLTLEGAAVPANRETTTFTISQDDIYALYSGASYDYDEDGVATPVWDNPDKPNRNTTTRKFVPGDTFQIKWKFTTADGRVFDSWSPSVCNEFPGANCVVGWTIVCAEEIEVPAGDWVFDMVDTYGDGWQGGYIGVEIDGVEVHQVFLLSQYAPGGVAISSGTQTISVPATATSLEFVWHDDEYDVECEFTITSPRGNVVADVSNPAVGTIRLDLCSE